MRVARNRTQETGVSCVRVLCVPRVCRAATNKRYDRKLFLKYETSDKNIVHFGCPLSKQLIRDPVLGAHGIRYEREYLKEYISRTHKNTLGILRVKDPTNQEYFLVENLSFNEAKAYKDDLLKQMETWEIEEAKVL